MFDRRYIFNGSIFHCYVSLSECSTLDSIFSFFARLSWHVTTLEFGSQEGLQNSLATRAAEAVAALQEVAVPAPAAPTRHVASSGAGNGIIQMLQKLSRNVWCLAAPNGQDCTPVALHCHCIFLIGNIGNVSYFLKIQVIKFASPMASER